MINFFRQIFKLSYQVKINNKFFFVTRRPWWKKVNSGNWEPHTFEIFDSFLDKNSVFIDIGAWIGPTTLYGSQIAKMCYSIEPDPVSYKELNENVELNPKLKSKIKIFNFCIGDRCAKVKFGNKYHFGNSSSSMLFGDLADSLDVDCFTLEKFIAKEKIEKCNFIKMDIEGGEVIVLPSIKDYLKKNTPTLYLSLHPHYFTNLKKDSRVIIDSLKSYKKLYLNDRRQITVEALFSEYLLKKIKCEILATNKEWTK